MTNEDLKRMSKVLDERLKPLIGELAKVKSELSDSRTTQFRNYSELTRIGKDIARIDSTLETINEDLGLHTKSLADHNKKLDALWEQTIEVTTGLEEIKDILKSHTNILKQTTSMTNDNIKKVDKRLTEAESHIGIVPPPELTIAR